MLMNTLTHASAAVPRNRWLARGRIVVIALLAGLWGAACSQPTIDGSSERRYLESMEEVRASLPADERGRFDNAVARIHGSWAVGHLGDGLSTLAEDAVAGLSGKPRERPERPTPFHLLHGLTADQVIAMADSM